MTDSTPSYCFVIAVYNETKFTLSLSERTIEELLSKAVSESLLPFVVITQNSFTYLDRVPLSPSTDSYLWMVKLQTEKCCTIKLRWISLI